MAAYYNENDKKTAAWLRELIKRGLIADGEVDDRSISDVQPRDLNGFVQCHFFAGIGGWSYALRLAGWPDDQPVWTGSCPCQPHSSASRGRRTAIDRWPEWWRLIEAERPDVVFGEQVDEALGWLDTVWNDMESIGHTFWPVILPACCVGQDHVRERIYFAGYTNCESQSVGAINGEVAGLQENRSIAGIMASQDGVPTRVGRLRGYGNAIVPQVAAEFIAAYMDSLSGGDDVQLWQGIA